MTDTSDLLIVGAGPCGLAVAIAATQAGLSSVVVDRRTIVSTIERYPLQMTFFSTPERIEIGGIPFIASHEKPTRADGLIYYRRVAEHFRLDVRPGEDVVDVAREPDGAFIAEVARPHDAKRYRAANVVFATGYYDNPNFLRVPGEELPHVAHYFLEGHPYWHRRVIVIGAGNRSVDASLECWRAGATVTVVHFGEGFDRTVKAYTTRVGNGPLPTEAESPFGERLREMGGEFGSVTGRPRRCGWFDATVVRYAVRVNGLTGLAVTKLDVLDSFSEIPVGTAYRLDDTSCAEMPTEVDALGRVKPIYEVHEGWRQLTGGARKLSDLPSAARAYLDRLEALSGAPVRYVSVGTRRDQIIEV